MSFVGGQAGKVTSSEHPKAIGRFQIRRFLGEGAFGAVYEGFDPQLDRSVAIKVAKLGRGDAEQRVKRFLREAKSAAGLRHPHIVPVHEFGQEGDLFYIVSAFIKGRTLQDALKADKGKPIDLKRAGRIVRQLADALAYAHGQGIVHRDVKPANVMLDDKDEPMLMDFGLATRQEEAEKLTHAGAVLGTPLYMAPEQAKGEDVVPVSDQYSLGVMLFEMITGRPPFTGSAEIVMHKHAEEDAPRPSKLNRAVSRDLETVCLKSLEKQPERRYANDQALAEDLRRWLEGEPIQARRIGWKERAWKWARRKPLAASLLVAVVLVGLTGLIAVLHQLGETNKALGVAQKNADDFKTASEQAQKNETLAKKNEADAVQANGLAQTEAQRAKKALEQEEKAKLQQARNLYTAHMNMVQRYWEQGDPHLAKPLLEKQIPEKDGDPDFRGFEWYYYWKLCNVGPPAISSNILSDPVRGIAWTPGAKSLAYIAGNRVYLWDSEKKGPPLSLAQFADLPTSLAYSPDGKTLAIGLGTPKKPGSIHLWDSENKKIKKVLAGHKYPVISVAYSPDGTRLISGSANLSPGTGGFGAAFFYTNVFDAEGEIKLWNSETGELLESVESKTSAKKASEEIAVVLGKPIKLTHQTSILKSELTPQDEKFKEKGYRKRFSVEMKEDNDYVIELHSNAFDAYLYLEDPDGRFLAEDDDGGLIGGARIKFRTEKAGVYRFIVSSIKESQIGAFTLGISQSPANLLSETTELRGVLKARFSADGRRVYAGQTNGAIHEFDSAKLQDPIASWTDLRSPAWALCVHSRGTIAAGSSSLRFAAPGVAVNAGSAFTVGSSDRRSEGELVLRKPGQRPRFLPGHKGGLLDALFTPDGRTLITVGVDHMIRLWDSTDGQEKWSIKGHQKELWSLALAPDGKTLATGGLEGSIRLWDITMPQTWRMLDVAGDLQRSAFSPKGDKVLLLTGMGKYELIDVATLQTEEKPTGVVQFARDGRLLQFKNEGDICRFVPFGNFGGNGIELGRFDIPKGSNIGIYAMSDDFEWRIYEQYPKDSAPKRDKLVFHHWKTGQSHQVDVSGGRAMAFSKNCRIMAATFQSQFGLKAWDVTTGKERGRLVALPTGDLPGLAISSDGKQVATGCSDGTIRVYDDDLKELFNLRGHALAVKRLSFSEDGRYLLSNGWDQILKLWDLQTGEERLALPTPGVLGSAMSPNNRLLVLSGNGQTLFLDAAKDDEVPKYRKDLFRPNEVFAKLESRDAKGALEAMRT